MQKLHIATPLIESVALSKRIKGRVWLKMEALQPSGSFKLRGIGHACQHYHSKGAKRFISSSGGNAGIAVAYSGRKLQIPVIVVVPESTAQRAIESIEQESAEVIVKGKTWQEAHNYSITLAEHGGVYIHPFDNPLIWTGHSTLIDEVVDSNLMPDLVILSVGGGGLLCGIIEGLRRHGLDNVPVLAVETDGADSLSTALKMGRLVELEDIKSIATSLGAKKVASTAFEWSQQHEVISRVVSDKEAVDACLQFSIDHRLLVEPACGASLATLYKPVETIGDKENILAIVCGGAGVSSAQIDAWKHKLDDD